MTAPEQGPALIIMAAGIGSRYGGLKQIDPIGPNGEIIIDYSIYDALRAGFEQIVFLIRREIEAAFREKIGRKIEQRADTVYVFQEITNVPAGFQVPAERTKPWGTGHAVLSCKDVVKRPFAAINADDFYGPGAFQVLADYLRQACDRDGVYDYAMVGYTLRNTLSPFGSVARGVCRVSPDGYLEGVKEYTRIEKAGEDARYTENGEDWFFLSGDATVSLNTWGFTPSIFGELEARFPRFLEKNAGRILKAEFFLPDEVNAILQEGKARVKVLPTTEKWYGVTYPDDRAVVQAALREFVRQGRYPANLWGA